MDVYIKLETSFWQTYLTKKKFLTARYYKLTAMRTSNITARKTSTKNNEDTSQLTKTVTKAFKMCTDD